MPTVPRREVLDLIEALRTTLEVALEEQPTDRGRVIYTLGVLDAIAENDASLTSATAALARIEASGE